VTYILVFLSAFAFEVSYLLWIRFSVARQPVRSALLSMTTGALSLYATFQALHDMRYAPVLILGYGVGSYTVARIGTKS
jgi:hypothetical protein